MRELNGGGRSGNGGTLVAAAVAVLERQALSTSGGGHTTTTAPNVSIKVQTPQDNTTIASITSITNITTDTERSRKSASPLMRSESLKKLHQKNDENSLESDVKPKVSVIGARLKQNAKTFTSSITDVDVLCSDLMSNLEEALSEHHKENVNVTAVNERDITKSTRSGFAYVDLRQNDSASAASKVASNGVVLRRNGTAENNSAEVNRNSSSTTTSAGTSEDFEDSSDETPTDTDDSDTTESETSSGGDEEGVHVVNETLGLETITEEERPVTASSVRTNEGTTFFSSFITLYSICLNWALKLLNAI